MSATTAQQRLWSPSVRDLVPYTPGEQPKIQNLVKLNTNENPFPPSPKVREAILAALGDSADDLKLYPDPDATQLKQAIAQFHNIPVEWVFVGNGSDEVLAHAFAAFFVHPQLPVLFPNISYSFYPVYAQLYGVKAVQVPLNAQFEIDVTAYNTPAAGIILANPNAPTGVALTLAQIEQLLQQNRNCVVVIDEAYVDFGAQSAIGLIAQYDNLVVCQTTSKSRSLAGMRIGMMFAQPHLIEALERVKNSFNSYPMDRLAIAAGTASFNDVGYFNTCCQQVINLREDVVAGLKQSGFTVLPSKANFVFATHQTQPAADIQQALRQHGVIVRHFTNPLINNFLRITIGSQAQNSALLQALDAVLSD